VHPIIERNLTTMAQLFSHIKKEQKKHSYNQTYYKKILLYNYDVIKI
jgi:hypothetical protein